MTTDATLLSRRRFLVLGGAAATTVAVPGVARGATQARAAKSTSWLDRRTFSGRVGETFVVRGDDGVSVAARLSKVSNLPGTTPRGRSLARRADAFILTFTPVAGAPTGGAAIRAFSHPQLGSTQLFAAAGDTYTVVVNHSVPLGTASRWSSRAVRMGKRKSRRTRRARRSR
jgi:hypothetical protein